MKRIFDVATTLLTWGMVSCLALALLLSPQVAMADDDISPPGDPAGMGLFNCISCTNGCVNAGGVAFGFCVQQGIACVATCSCKTGPFGTALCL